MNRPRRLARRVAARVAGERRLPVGGVARDRRLLRRALGRQRRGRVLVVGPGLAARQVLAPADVDVTGTSPHSAEVTVCTTALGAGTLPPARWDTIIVSDPGPDWAARLAAVLPACRGRLLVLDRAGRPLEPDEIERLTAAARVRDVVGGSRRRVWVMEVDR